MKIKCPKCRHDNPGGAKFCNECGYHLYAIGELSPIDYTQPYSYTPKFLADKILSTRSAMEGERKRVTVLFADVVGFTSMSEKLDPEQVHQIMNGCFDILMEEIHKFEGIINQFTGDGVMALFGAPIAIENHAQNGCHAALAMQKAVKTYGREVQKKYGLEFKMRIGLNTGPVIVGSIGDDLKMDYTAIGDTVNLASRMESSAEPGTILVSPYTCTQAGKNFIFKPLGKTEVKGKEAPLDVYTLVEKIDRFGAGMDRQIYSEMVGRHRELNKLELQVGKAIDGYGSVVNVIGEAGIGKSRLISELRNSPMMQQVTLLEGRAISIGRNLSFHPIIDLLKHWAKISEDDSEASSLGKLETAIRNVCKEGANEIIPFVATLMGMKLTGRYAERIKGIEGEALEKLILKNIKDFIIQSTKLTPLLIVIEDLHWADTSSIELLESLFRLAETHRVLFINVFRPNHPETGEKIVESLKEKISVYHVEITLGPLNEQMSETLIDNMLNIKGLHHGIKNKIVQQAGGNPFFIEEVVRSFIDTGAVIVKNGNFEVTDRIDAIVIPPTINDVLMARIDRLEDKTRDLVKVASVIGRNFFHKILTEVSKEAADIDNRLLYLKEIQLIRERKRLDELEYLFKHALAQEAAYASILHRKRKEIHLKVARSIEKVFDERLHEFYGMLALHYIKGEDNEKAEYYLVKAGEEAMKASASSEALNYYQEGLKLYLQPSKGTADPEKLAMFEKNIALALYSKSCWVESVEHFDKVLEYWNVPTHPNRIFVLMKSMKNIFSIITGLDRLVKKAKPAPGQRDIAILNLFFLRNCAVVYFDNIRLFFQTLNAFNRAIKIDMAKSPEAINILSNMGGMFGFTGLSFKLSRKFLQKSNDVMDIKNTGILMPFTHLKALLYHNSGDWKKIGSYNEALVADALLKGDFFNSTSYMWWFFMTKTERGDFAETEHAIKKLSEIADNYDFHGAGFYAYHLKSDLLLKKRLLSEALAEAERGSIHTNRHGTELEALFPLSIRAEIFALLNSTDKATELLLQAQNIVARNEFLVPCHLANYLYAHFVLDIVLLKKAMVSNNRVNLSKLKKKAHHSGNRALNNSKKYAPFRVKTLRLTGEYYWLIGKQKNALKWWDKAIKTGEDLGARPDLSRICFEVGKRLLEPDSKHKELNGITAEEYLEKARTMFEDMDLQWDLDELDKVMAGK